MLLLVIYLKFSFMNAVNVTITMLTVTIMTTLQCSLDGYGPTTSLIWNFYEVL